MATDNKGQEFTGKVKEGVGKATDDENLEAQGKNDQTKSNLKQAARRSRTPSSADRRGFSRESVGGSG